MPSELDLDRRLERLAPTVDVDAALAALQARTGRRTPRRHRLVLTAAACALLALAGAVALAARGPSGREVATQGPGKDLPADVIPFALQPVADPSDVAACTPAMVTLEVLPASAEGQRAVGLTARPGQSCALAAWPELAITIGTGQPGHIEGDPSAPAGPDPAPLVLTGHRQLVGSFSWLSSCGLRDLPRTLTATLPGGGDLTAPLFNPPACLVARPEMASSWAVQDVTPTPSPLEVRLTDLPAEAPADGTLSATVELTNPSDTPVALDPCPTYTFTYGNASMDNQVNCAEAPTAIEPGDRLRFAVELAIDPGAAGEATLVVHFAGGVTAEAVTVQLGIEGGD